jgi:hypothetical protein
VPDKLNEEPKRPIQVRPPTLGNRIIWALAQWSLGAAVLGILGVPLAALLLPLSTVRAAAHYVLLAAVLSDLTAVCLDVTYLLRKGGEHGIAFYAFAYYCVFVIFGMRAAWWWRVLALVGLFLLHVGCQWYLPQPIARRLGWRPEGPDPDSRGE